MWGACQVSPTLTLCWLTRRYFLRQTFEDPRRQELRPSPAVYWLSTWAVSERSLRWGSAPPLHGSPSKWQQLWCIALCIFHWYVGACGAKAALPYWFRQPLKAFTCDAVCQVLSLRLRPILFAINIINFLSPRGLQTVTDKSAPWWHLNLLPHKSSVGVVCPWFAPTQYCELDCGWKWLTPVTYRPVVPSTFQPLVVVFFLMGFVAASHNPTLHHRVDPKLEFS